MNEAMDSDCAETSTHQVQGQSEEKRHSAEWQTFNTKIKTEHSKFDGLLKMGKIFQSLSEMVVEGSCQVGEMRALLHKANQIQPDEIKESIDLALIEDLFAHDHLSSAHRDTIVLCLFEASKSIAHQTIETGMDMAAMTMGNKQTRILVQVWKTILKTLLNIRALTKQIDLQRFREYCEGFGEALKLIKQDEKLRTTKVILFLRESLNTMRLELSIPGSSKSDLNALICRLKHTELEQNAARRLNNQHVKRVNVLNIFQVLKVAFFGFLVGGNFVAVKAAMQLKKVAENKKLALKAQSRDMDQLSGEINQLEQTINENFLKIDDLFHNSFDLFEQIEEFEHVALEIEKEFSIFDVDMQQFENEIEIQNGNDDDDRVHLLVTLCDRKEAQLFDERQRSVRTLIRQFESLHRLANGHQVHF